uniref:Putative secreted protein n=1 Tax=Ixodes ricinus TaxID=34613 RepID=V5GJM6_IXORI
MIVIGIFLLFTAVPLACVAEESARNSNQCSKVTSSSFPSCGSEQNLQIYLGMYCSIKYPDHNMGGQWIGYTGTGARHCQVCCAHKDKHGNITYLSTTSPDGFPCDGRKVCKAGTCPK